MNETLVTRKIQTKGNSDLTIITITNQTSLPQAVLETNMYVLSEERNNKS
jgi:hypothetical protein